ncbi:MAG: hypothetical protein ACHQK8_08250 [Bacteroidia bacterium]
MKNLNKYVQLFIIFLLVLSSVVASAQANLKVTLRYYNFNNKIPYLAVRVLTKTEGKLQPVPGIEMKFYMDEVSNGNLVGKAITNNYGEAIAVIPASLKSKWDSDSKHKFTCSSPASKEYSESETEIEITKAKLVVDTVSEGETRSIAVMVMEYKNSNWVPVKDVETKVGVSRLGGGFLNVSKEETYTTDSAGKLTAEFKRDKLPGDDHGNITLVVKTEDNENYGNLVSEKMVPWGVSVIKENDFDKRTLYSARFKTPVWLLAMAYTVIGLVWGDLIYLIYNVLKIMKMGNEAVAAGK